MPELTSPRRCSRCNQETLVLTGKRYRFARGVKVVDAKEYQEWACPCGQVVGAKSDGSGSRDKRYHDVATI